MSNQSKAVAPAGARQIKVGRRQETIHARRWYILAVLGLSLLLVNIDNMILNVALKTIQESLGASQGDMQWAVDSYVVVFAGLLFTWGVLGDRFGRRRVLLIGLAIFGVTSALCAFAHTPGQLIAGRALMGVGGAAVMPQTLSIIANVFEPSERGRAISIWAGFTGVAIAVGPATGGLLIEHFWWGSIFLVNVPVVAVGLVLVAALVPESRDPDPRRVDPVGVPLSIVGLGLLVYGIITGGQTTEWASPRVLSSITAGLVVLSLFVLIQRRSAHPTLDVSLFTDPRFSAATLAIGLAFFGLTGAYFYLGYYFQVVRGYSALHAGLCLIPVAAALLIAAPRSARLAQRFGPRAVIGTGLTVVAACFAAHVFLDRTTPLWVVEALLFAQGAGMGNVFAPATNVIMNAVPRAKAATGSGVNTTVRQVGAALGVAVIGSILSAGYRAHLGSALDALPAPWRGTGADESVGATLTAVGRAAAALDSGRLPPETAGALSGVRWAATDAFLGAMHLSSLGAAAAALAGALLVWLFLPASQPTPRPTRDPTTRPTRAMTAVMTTHDACSSPSDRLGDRMSIHLARRARDAGTLTGPAAGKVRLTGVGTATSPVSYSQTELLDLLRVDDPQIRSVFLNSAIERRFLSLPPAGPDGSRPTESQGDLLAKHRVQGMDMGSRALEDCLNSVGAELSDVRYLCCVSSTGWLTPGFSALLIRELGLRADCGRLDVVGMGCNAGLNALNATTGWARANPGQLAVMLCVEVCSAAYVSDGTMRTSVVNSLFGDGAAAVAVIGEPQERCDGPVILRFASLLIPDAIDAMRYDWDDEHGKFSFFLDRDVPYVVGAHAERVVDRLLAGTGLRRSDIAHWIIHSGGKKVIDSIRVNLRLSRHDVRHTTGVLRDFGNLSSGSFLFSYHRLLAEKIVAPGDLAMFMTMGPGSTIESALLRF